MASGHKEDNFFRKKKVVNTNKKRIAIIVAMILFAVSIAYGVFLYANWSKPKTSVTDKSIDSVYDKLVTISRSQGSDSSQKYLDSELQKTSNPEEIAQIYIMKSGEADSIKSADNKAKSLEYAYQAEKVYPSYKSALAIARIEEWKGNLEVALKYYKLCIERRPSDSVDWTSDDTAYYEARIDKLEKAVNK